MSGKMCIYIRDRVHPADLYDSSGHTYAVSIHEVGSNSPLIWKGMNFNWVWLPFPGQSGRIAGEYEVPAGTYLVKGYASCYNVVTNLAWVQVADNETVSVNLVPTTVVFCLYSALIGVMLGGTKETPTLKAVPQEAEAFQKAANALIAKLPKEESVQFMPIEEVQKRLREAPKE
jgi:hypothetical protein